jgi:hypothetical protein
MCSEIHKLLHSIWNKEEMPHRGNNLSLYPFSRKAIRNIVVMIKVFFVIKYIQTFIQHPSVKVTYTCIRNYWGPSVSI